MASSAAWTRWTCPASALPISRTLRISDSASVNSPLRSSAAVRPGVSGREIGLEPDGLAELGDRLVYHPLARRARPSWWRVAVVIGPKPDRRAEFGDRLLHLPLSLPGRCRGRSGRRRSRAGAGWPRGIRRSTIAASARAPLWATARWKWAAASATTSSHSGCAGQHSVEPLHRGCWGRRRIAIAVFGDRLLPLTLAAQGVGRDRSGHRHCRAEVGSPPGTRRSRSCSVRLGHPGTPSVQGVCQADVGADEFGLEPDRRAEFGDRLLQLPLFCQGDAPVVVGVGVRRLLPPSLPETEAPQEGRADGRECRGR